MEEENNNVVVLNKFAPRDYQLDFCKAFESGKYKKMIAVWPRRCLSGNSFISIGDGFHCLLEDIKVGASLLSWNGKKLVRDKVLHKWVTDTKKTVRVIAGGSIDLVCSPDHMFAYMNRDSESVNWNRLDMIPRDAFLLCPEKNKIRKFPFKLEESEPEELYDIETKKHHNFIANDLLVHNSGKDLVTFNLILRSALRKVGLYAYCLPTYNQCRNVIFNAISTEGVRFLDFIPKELIKKVNRMHMEINLINGSIIKLVGSNKYDNSIVGGNALMFVFSEYAVSDERAYKLAASPILKGNNGTVIFIGTPRSKNHFYDLFKIAEQNPDKWYSSLMTIDETKHISNDEIEEEISSGETSREMAQQEYYCSFELGQAGSYYGDYMIKMNLDERIGEYTYQSNLPIYTSWDIGVNDTTCIIWFQISGNNIYIIDSYENNSNGLDHYVNIMKQKPYITSDTNFGPHDLRNREWISGNITRIDKAKELGLDFKLVPKLSIADGIEAVRTILPRVHIDRNKCRQLIKCLEFYHKEYDSKNKKYADKPKHDWSSNFCFVAGTKIKTIKGDVNIEDVRSGDFVITPLGKRKVLKIHKTVTDKTYIIKTLKSSFQCTASHQIFTNDGLTYCDSIKYNDILEYNSVTERFLWRMIFGLFLNQSDIKGFKKTILSLKMKSKLSLMVSFLDGIEVITDVTPLNKEYQHCKEQFGKLIKVKYQKTLLFITKMAIRKITTLKTWKSWIKANISQCMQSFLALGRNLRNVKNCLSLKEKRLKHGIKVKKEKSGINNMHLKACQQLEELNINSSVLFVEKNMKQNKFGKNIVLNIVSMWLQLGLRHIMKIVFAVFAKVYSIVINTILQKHVVKSVQLNSHQELEEVYDLTIDTDNCYYANGYLVSNCDAVRYLAISVKGIRKGMSSDDVKRLYNKSRYGNQRNFPVQFRD